MQPTPELVIPMIPSTLPVSTSTVPNDSMIMSGDPPPEAELPAVNADTTTDVAVAPASSGTSRLLKTYPRRERTPVVRYEPTWN